MGSYVARVALTGRTPGRRSGTRTEPDSPGTISGPAVQRADWIVAVQRLAGNRAVAAELGRLAVQRDEPAPVARPVPLSSPDGPGRPPNKSEFNDHAGVVPDKPWRVLRAAEDGYNCYAWAVGSTSTLITDAMVEPSGNSPTLDSWTKYLATNYGFTRSADGLDPSADLILYGDGPTQILHAARRADAPYRELTFSSKLGGGVDQTPVILHAPADLATNLYGRPLRSFWRGTPAPAATPTP